MSNSNRLHALDAVRAFALLLGVVFHASMSFIPGMPLGVWAITDSSPSAAIGVLAFVSHIFRMTLFLFLAGFLARMMFHRKGAKAFWADRAKRIGGPFVVGWILLAPAIAAVWLWGIYKTFGVVPPRPADAASGGLPLFHLWFLYFLLLMYVAVTVVRALVDKVGVGGWLRRAADGVVRSTAQRGIAALVLGVPLSLALYFHPNWTMWFGIPVPDRGFTPILASSICYGTAFAFGWLVNRQSDVFGIWQRQWPGHIAAAIVATGACLAIGGITPTFAVAPEGVAKLAFAMCYCVAIWCWVFGITGAAMRFLSAESPTRRYVADSSYWIYLAHLPVVCAFQVAVGKLPWHWAVKFPLVLVASFTVLFLSYHFLVRYTFIGAVLNGRKQRPARERTATESSRPALLGGLRGPAPSFAEDVR